MSSSDVGIFIFSVVELWIEQHLARRQSESVKIFPIECVLKSTRYYEWIGTKVNYAWYVYVLSLCLQGFPIVLDEKTNQILNRKRQMPLQRTTNSCDKYMRGGRSCRIRSLPCQRSRWIIRLDYTLPSYDCILATQKRFVPFVLTANCSFAYFQLWRTLSHNLMAGELYSEMFDLPAGLFLLSAIS